MTSAKPQPPAPPPAAPRVTQAFIDGVADGIARLLLPESADSHSEWRTYHLPALVLPKDAKEGGWIELSVHTIAAPSKPDAKALRQKLGRSDRGGNFSL